MSTPVDSGAEYKSLLPTIGKADASQIADLIDRRSGSELASTVLTAAYAFYCDIKIGATIYSMVDVALRPMRNLRTASQIARGYERAAIMLNGEPPWDMVKKCAMEVAEADAQECAERGTTFKLVGIEQLIIRDWRMIEEELNRHIDLRMCAHEKGEVLKRLSLYMLVVEAESEARK